MKGLENKEHDRDIAARTTELYVQRLRDKRDGKQLHGAEIKLFGVGEGAPEITQNYVRTG